MYIKRAYICKYLLLLYISQLYLPSIYSQCQQRTYSYCQENENHGRTIIQKDSICNEKVLWSLLVNKSKSSQPSYSDYYRESRFKYNSSGTLVERLDRYDSKTGWENKNNTAIFSFNEVNTSMNNSKFNAAKINHILKIISEQVSYMGHTLGKVNYVYELKNDSILIKRILSHGQMQTDKSHINKKTDNQIFPFEDENDIRVKYVDDKHMSIFCAKAPSKPLHGGGYKLRHGINCFITLNSDQSLCELDEYSLGKKTYEYIDSKLSKIIIDKGEYLSSCKIVHYQ